MMNRVFSTLLLSCLVATIGFAQEATKEHFVDNGNGTVTDNQTGLMWQKEDDETKRPYDEAVAYCKDLSLGGFVDWRLPKPDEVTTAVKREFYRKPREDAATALSYEQVRMLRQLGVEIQGADRYWTEDPDDIALFNVTPNREFHTIKKASKDTPLFVRAVRYTAARKVQADATKDVSDEQMIASIKTNSQKASFFIKDIQPQANSYRGKVTILSASTDPSGPVLVQYENAQHDIFGPIFPMGDESIHVFKARYEFAVNAANVYRFEGTENDPLVFALINKLGYVYLRGAGTVYFPNGTKKQFPK